MDNLPSLVLNEIFSYFNLREKFKLKQVCKRWRNEINNYQPTTLMIHLKPFRPNIDFSITNSINKYEQSFCIYELKEFDFIYSKLLNLKRLFLFEITLIDPLNTICNKINDFKLLEQLELHCLEMNDLKLELLNLRILAMRYTFFTNLQLNTPKLNSLVCFEEINKVKLINPKSLTYLFIFRYDQCINQFSNLEYLLCTYFDKIDRNLLESLSKLKQIQFNISSGIYTDLTVLNDLKRQKNLYKLNDLEIIELYFDHVYLGANEDYSINENNIELVKANYHRIPFNLQWTFEIEYSSLIKTFNYQLPIDFFKRFIDIEFVRINGQVNQLDLFNFLKQCISIYGIWSDETNLNQHFFNNLYQLKSLEFFSFTETLWQLNDYKFLENSKLLNNFEIFRPYLPMQFVRNCLQKVNDLKFIKFRDNKFDSAEYKITFVIYKKENEKFQLIVQNKDEHIFNTSDDLIKFLKNNELTKDFIAEY